MTRSSFVRAARLSDVQAAGCCYAVQVGNQTMALYADGDRVYAVDNRCPHMGFPLDRGTVRDGILSCHWHHARFDLASGGTFDLWAGDVRAFPVEVRDGEVWVDASPETDAAAYHQQRLGQGLERNLSLVIAKSVLALMDSGGEAVGPFRAGLAFGARYRRAGWGQGLTMHTCMINLLPHLYPDDRPRALYHGLAAVASECSGAPPRFPVQPLPGAPADLPTLKRWFRQFVEVRDAEGAERCIASAVQAGADSRQMADMLFAAATDHRYIQIGHVLDFTNKALEALDLAGWDQAEPVLTSLAPGYTNASRMEEANAWRYPVDLVGLFDAAFEALPTTLETGRDPRHAWLGAGGLVSSLLGEDPEATIQGLLEALGQGCSPTELAGIVSYAAALRIARFHTSNEFSDWDTALHTFTFAHAVEQGMRRAPSAELLSGVFDAAMSVYLDRFLNVPPARLPEPDDGAGKPAELLAQLPVLLDRQQQVNQAGEVASRYLHGGGSPEQLLATLGALLLRENRDFHTIQAMEAAVQQFHRLRGRPEAVHVIVAATRYLAAHAPTVRSQGQTYRIARRLARGERLFEDQ